MSKKLNTAIICLSPYYGGMELDAIRYAKLLSESVRTIFIAKKNSQIDKNFRKEATTHNITFELIPFSLNFSLSIILRVRKLIEKHSIKNVIFFGASEMRSLYFSFLAKDINLLIRHGTTKSHPKKDLLHRLIYSKVNWHIPICKHIQNNVSFIIPFGENTQTRVIYPSLRYLPSKIPSQHHGDEIKLLHVSRITSGKGHVDTIQACHALHIRNIPFRLTFVGAMDENFKGKIEDALANCPFRDKIEFTGFSTQVAGFYETNHIFIFPSKGEGLSNAFIEALSFGLVCIAYANTSFPELHDSGFDFILANNADVSDLSSSLLKAVDQVQQGRFPVMKNIELAAVLFDKQRELNELLELLK